MVKVIITFDTMDMTHLNCEGKLMVEIGAYKREVNKLTLAGLKHYLIPEIMRLMGEEM